MKLLRQNISGLAAVFLIYFYFLEFSQFTLLHLLEEQVESPAGIKTILAAMALAGIGGSVLAWMIGKQGNARQLFGPAFLACSLVALTAPLVSGFAAFVVLSVVMGLAVGFLTVSTAALLPGLLPGPNRGLLVGIATGLAYAACNVPALFHAGAEPRALVIGLVLLMGGIPYLRWMVRDTEPPRATLHPPAFLPWRWHWVVLAFLVLVWLDSALFYILQETPSLKQISWAGEGRAWINGGVHLAAAIFTGWILDRGWSLLPLLLGWLALVAGASGLQFIGWPEFTLLYVSGVSFYSCALVFLPSLGSAHEGESPAFVRALLVYAIAGWIGSGLGIGMAENLHRVPLAFIVVSTLVLIPVMKLSFRH